MTTAVVIPSCLELNDPKARKHRPRAPQLTVMLMVETSAIIPTGS